MEMMAEWEGENSLKGAVLRERGPRTAPSVEVMQRVCGARNRGQCWVKGVHGHNKREERGGKL